MDIAAPGLQTEPFYSLFTRECMCQILSLQLQLSLRYGQHNILAAILKLKVVPPGVQNLISLSPLWGTSLCEVTWLWLKYFLLYRSNEKSRRMEGWMEGRTECWTTITELQPTSQEKILTSQFLCQKDHFQQKSFFNRLPSVCIFAIFPLFWPHFYSQSTILPIHTYLPQYKFLFRHV